MCVYISLVVILEKVASQDPKEEINFLSLKIETQNSFCQRRRKRSNGSS
jgi:hypothetical protein